MIADRLRVSVLEVGAAPEFWYRAAEAAIAAETMARNKEKNWVPR